MTMQQDQDADDKEPLVAHQRPGWCKAAPWLEVCLVVLASTELTLEEITFNTVVLSSLTIHS